MLDGDQGLNTGGMGAYAPTPLISPKQYQECMRIVQVTYFLCICVAPVHITLNAITKCTNIFNMHKQLLLIFPTCQQRTVTAMAEEGNPLVGVLYAGFMLNSTATDTICSTGNSEFIDEPGVAIGTPLLLEFNCRFGDPETEVLVSSHSMLIVVC